MPVILRQDSHRVEAKGIAAAKGVQRRGVDRLGNDQQPCHLNSGPRFMVKPQYTTQTVGVATGVAGVAQRATGSSKGPMAEKCDSAKVYTNEILQSYAQQVLSVVHTTFSTCDSHSILTLNLVPLLVVEDNSVTLTTQSLAEVPVT